MLWRLLGHALDLSNPESDTLIEEALRLLVSVLNNATAFMPALQVRPLLPHPAKSLFSRRSPGLQATTLHSSERVPAMKDSLRLLDSIPAL